MKRKSLVVLLTAVLLSGCAAGRSVTLTPLEKQQLATVRVDERVQLPKEVAYYGPEQTAGFLFGGLVGELIAASMVTAPKVIAQYLSTNDINVGTIVREEFVRQLSYRPDYQGRLSNDAAARFELEVKIYGIAQKHGLSSEYKPLLGVNAKLVSADGKTMWEQYEFVTNLNSSTPGSPYDAYFQSPEAFRTAYAEAARLIVRDLLKTLS